VVVDRFVPAAPEVVWDLLVDTSRWPEWGPSVTAVELDDAPATPATGTRITAGSTGRVRTAVGVWVPFRITGFNDGRRWSWNVAGIPATSHTVEPAPGGCRVGFGIPLLVAPYALVCQVALARIERLAR
jgi:hypothetical protein